MHSETYTFANLDQFVGRELGVSDWVMIDQARINAFADATGDHQWIHVDPARAAASPLGATIAHGFLTLALLPMLTETMGLIPAGVQFVLNYGTDRVRFVNFVRVNSRVRNRVSLAGAEPKSGGVLLKFANTMEIEGESKPAMIAETLMLAFPA